MFLAEIVWRVSGEGREEEMNENEKNVLIMISKHVFEVLADLLEERLQD